MNTVAYNFLKGWFILSFMVALFFIFDILHGIVDGLEIAPITHMNADWAILGLMILILLGISSCLYFLWALKHDV